METKKVVRLDRKLNAGEVLHVANMIYKLVAKRGAEGHPLAPYVSFEGIHRTLKMANANGYLDAYVYRDRLVGVIMYDFGTPWWANCQVLQELTVFTVDPNFVGFGRIALERLKELATEHDCVIIETGSVICLDPGPVKNLYMKKGKYQFSYPNFVHIVNCGINK